MLPCTGRCRPSTQASKVVVTGLFGPNRPKISPGCTLRVTLRRACTCRAPRPYTAETLSMAITGCRMACPLSRLLPGQFRTGHPGPMEAVRHAPGQQHPRYRRRTEVAGLDYHQLACAASCIVHVGDQPAVIFPRGVGAWHEHAFTTRPTLAVHVVFARTLGQVILDQAVKHHTA